MLGSECGIFCWPYWLRRLAYGRGNSLPATIWEFPWRQNHQTHLGLTEECADPRAPTLSVCWRTPSIGPYNRLAKDPIRSLGVSFKKSEAVLNLIEAV
jgi:hypothetical protein